MIKNKEQLKQYLEMDKKALGVKYRKPHLIGDYIWKFEIILRKHEYFLNTNTSVFWCKVYGYLHFKMGIKLGFSIPCNVFGGGYA